METLLLVYHVIPKQTASIWWHTVFVPITFFVVSGFTIFLVLSYKLWENWHCV